MSWIAVLHESRSKTSSIVAHHSPSLAVGAGSCSEISADSIGDYSICFKDNILFGYFDYRGDEDRKHWEKMASDPKLRNE
jgi:L-rhamnose mutarotase